MRVVLTVLLMALGVHCAPGFQSMHLTSPNIPLGKNHQTGYNVEFSEDGVSMNEHKESRSEKNFHSEKHTKTSDQTFDHDGDSTHLSQGNSENDEVHKSSESQKETEDRGLKLNKDGFKAFDRKKQEHDRSTYDQESGKSSSMQQDTNGSSTHYKASGNQHEKTSKTKDHDENYENQKVSFGRDGGGLFTKEKGQSSTHDAKNEEHGNSWGETRDQSKDEHGSRTAASKQGSHYSQTDEQQTAANSRQHETKTYEAEDSAQTGKEPVSQE